MLSEREIDLLTEMAEESGLTVSEHVRRAIDYYLAVTHAEKDEAGLRG